MPPTMPVAELSFLSSIGKIISAIWANGSRFLWSLAGAAAATAVVLRVCAFYAVPKAKPWWDEYGLPLILGAAVFGVFAACKAWTEQNNTQLYLIANEHQSFWNQATQPDGLILTQFTLRFDATNRAGHHLALLKVRIVRPWVRRKQVLTSMLSVEGHGNGDTIPPRTRRPCHALLIARGIIGGAGRKKPMRVKIALQDNIGRWHKLKFIDVRDPQFTPN
jgi:hypothetical protein